jgi:hypothetical protein
MPMSMAQETNAKGVQTMNKVIWSCWFQGRQNAPDLVQRCLASWETLNPGWDFRYLDAESAGRYVDIDEHVDLHSQTITAASLSDILRLMLLHQYGGVWVDATLYCNQPLDEWLPLAMGTGFFAFARPGPDRALASWFLAAAPGNMLLAKWAASATRYWRGRKLSDDYFWVHHLFGDLCSSDPDARAAWESVPKVSADGPHAIQTVGMYTPAESDERRIDWTTPVFKLTHRLDEGACQPGCLVHHLLHSRDLAKPKRSRAAPDSTQTVARIAGLKVSTENLGDHIQIHAGLRLLKRLGLAPEQWIDRDNEIATGTAIANQQRPLGILLNGWFKTNPAEWPPHPRLVPIYLGFHIRLFQSPTLISAEALEHYRRFGPIGCRDRHTLSLLKSHGVDAFLSHCLSLTLPRRLDDPENQTETFIVSRDKRILDYLSEEIRSCRFVCHYTGTTDFTANMRQALELLALYRSRAKLVVTTMLHCALPMIAMGIPVVVFFPPNEGPQHSSNLERFSSLQEMMRVFHLNETDCVDWGGYSADVSGIKLRLIDRLFELAHRWGRAPGTCWGPIAPSSALMPPSPEMLERRIRYSLQSDASVPDRRRWGDPSSYKPDWSSRARLAAPLIPDGARVLEIGVGTSNLRDLIRHRCSYTGADLEPLDADTIPLDIGEDPLPQGQYDCIVALGVFEYLYKLPIAAAKIAAATDRIVLSYCCAREGAANIASARNGRGWVNDLSEVEFTQVFASLGFGIASRTPFNTADDFEQIIFEFQRA